jgi:hypothetical protein
MALLWLRPGRLVLRVGDGVIICHVPSVPLRQVSLRLWCGADPA